MAFQVGAFQYPGFQQPPPVTWMFAGSGKKKPYVPRETEPDFLEKTFALPIEPQALEPVLPRPEPIISLPEQSRVTIEELDFLATSLESLKIQKAAREAEIKERERLTQEGYENSLILLQGQIEGIAQDLDGLIEELALLQFKRRVQQQALADAYTNQLRLLAIAEALRQWEEQEEQDIEALLLLMH